MMPRPSSRWLFTAVLALFLIWVYHTLFACRHAGILVTQAHAPNAFAEEEGQARSQSSGRLRGTGTFAAWARKDAPTARVPVTAFRPRLPWAEHPVVAPFRSVAEAEDASDGSASGAEDFKRRSAVRGAMRHAWSNYAQYAWGHDELRTLGKTGGDIYGGIGATIFDAADTLLLMGMADEAKKAADFIAGANFAGGGTVSVFESTIRLIGGAVALYELSGDRRQLSKAAEVADALRGAFDTESGLPNGLYDTGSKRFTRHGWARGSFLADCGTLSLEWWKLTQHTGNPVYNATVQRPMEIFRQFTAQTGRGILPNTWTLQGTPADLNVAFGAFGDSYYEYLLKFWLLTGKEHDVFRDMWLLAIDDMLANLLTTHARTGLTYIADGAFSPDGSVHKNTKHDHFTCFMGGLLALGVHHKAVTGPRAVRYLEVAEQIAHTCYYMHRFEPSGLSPDETNFAEGQLPTVQSALWSLRPETVESLFVLYRVTGNATYQEWGWTIFQSIERNARGLSGYHSVDVTAVPATPGSDEFNPANEMQHSYFLSETLKYLFLLFAPKDYLRLDEWVFNTEGHPLRISSSSGAWGTRI